MDRRASYLFMALLVLLTLTYFSVEGYRYLSDPFSTALAYSYQAEEGLELTGCVVREEVVLPEEESAFLRLTRSEGERVSRGGTVAVVYADQASLDAQAELDTLSDRLEQLRYARDLRSGAEASSRLDSQIFSTLTRYREYVAADRLDRAAAQGAQLRSLVFKRDYTSADLATLNQEIASLEARLEELSGGSGRILRRITAPEAGLYSAVADGYETALTPASIRGMTPSALSAVLSENAGAPASAIGKLALGDAWYYIATLSQEEARELRARQEANLSLRFSKSAERDFPVELQSISRAEEGRVAVVFRSDRYLPEVTLLRRQTARLIFGTVEGLRAPKEALRMAPYPEADSPQVTGLYCVVGTEARFKPVKVIYTGENFILVESTAEKERLLLRSGDEIIVQAADLYDGKVVSSSLP